MTHTQINKLYFLDYSVFYVWTVRAFSAFVGNLFVAQFGTLFWTRPPSVCSCQRAQTLLSIHLDFEDKHGDKECVQDALNKPWMIASVSPIWALPSPHQRRHSVTLPTPLHIPTCWLSQSSLAYFPPRYQFWQKSLEIFIFGLIQMSPWNMSQSSMAQFFKGSSNKNGLFRTIS